MLKRLSPWILLSCAFLLFFVIYLTGAVWPLFVSEQGFREGALGLILGFYGLSLFLARSPIGFLCDLLVGYRRIVISAGFLSLAVAHLLPAVYVSTWSLVASRVLIGVGAGSFVAIIVLFTLYFPSGSARFSTVVAASFFGWGQVIANPLGGWLADGFGVLRPFWVAFYLSVAGALLVLAIVEPDQKTVSVKKVLLPRSINLYITAFMMAVVFLAIYATVYNVTQLYASSQLEINKTTQGILLTTYVSLFVIVVLISPRLEKAFGSTSVITAGMIFLAVGVLLTPNANLPVLFVCEALTGIGLGLTFGLLMALSVENIPVGQRFYAMGIFQSIYAIGMLIGPTAAGYITQASGFSVTFYSTGSFVLLTGALFVFARSGLFKTITRHQGFQEADERRTT